MALQLLSADELKALLSDRTTAEKLVPDSTHMGISYTLNGSTAVYKQTDYPNLYFFETSTSEGGSHRVLKFEKPTSIYERSGSSGPFYTVASLTQEIQNAYNGATNITFLKMYKDSNTVSPTLTYSNTSTLVGDDSLVMGRDSVCHSNNSLVIGKSLYIGNNGDTSRFNEVLGHNNILMGGSDFSSIRGYNIDAIEGSSYNSLCGDNIHSSQGSNHNTVVGSNIKMIEGASGNRISGNNVTLTSSSIYNDISCNTLSMRAVRYSDIKGQDISINTESNFSTIFGQSIQLGQSEGSSIHAYPAGMTIDSVIYSSVVTSQKCEAEQILQSTLCGSSVDMPGCNFQYGSAIGSNIIHRPLSQAEILSSTNTPQTQYNSHIANLDIIGGGTVYLGGNTCHSGIHLISDPNNTSTTSNYIGYWNVWNSPNWRSNPSAYVFSADVIGSNNYIGLGTNHTTVRGKNNYTPAHSTSVAIYGDYFNVYYANEDSSKFLHANHGSWSWGVGNTAIAATDFNTLVEGSGDFGYIDEDGVNWGGTVVGNAQGTDKSGNPYNFTGVTAYVKVEHGVITAKASDVSSPWYPAGNERILSIGNRNSLPNSAHDVLLYGNDLRLWGGNVYRSVFVANKIHLNSWGDCPDSHRPEIKGSVFVDTCLEQRDSASFSSENGRLTTMNSIDSSLSDAGFHYMLNDAFMFVNSMRNRDDRNWGVFPNDNTGLQNSNLFTANGTTTSSYIEVAPYSMAHKPDTSMVYAGGIALLGLRDTKTSDDSTPVSGFGLLKLGSLYDYTDSTSSYVTRTNYVKTFTTKHDPDSAYSHGLILLTPGTNSCPYAHMPLLVMPTQEIDGTFRIGAGKIWHDGIDLIQVFSQLTSDEKTAIKNALGIS